jgi:hypothetical protein
MAILQMPTRGRFLDIEALLGLAAGLFVELCLGCLAQIQLVIRPNPIATRTWAAWTADLRPMLIPLPLPR